jgi:cytochrome c peroxidase
MERLLNSPTMGSSRWVRRGIAGFPPMGTRRGTTLGCAVPSAVDLQSRDEYCGRFMTPSLRNVATAQNVLPQRRVPYAEGSHRILCAVGTPSPEKWYPRNPDGSVNKFDDLPPKYQGNVEMGPPFGRSPGASRR